jgi:hypothetical protein
MKNDPPMMRKANGTKFSERDTRSCLLTVSGKVIGTCAWLLLSAIASPAADQLAKWHPGHYVFVGTANINAKEHLLEHFRGVQKCYGWSALEMAEGRYDFSAIEQDLTLLKNHGKYLVIQVQYKAFGKGRRLVPAYVQGPEYGGGVYRASSGSFDPVIWNKKVGERMDAFFAALGREFDNNPTVEAVVLPETSPSANLIKAPQPGVERYTEEIYLEGLKQRLTAMRRAFPHTVVIQYVNYPANLLPELTDYMKSVGVGMGGPDVYPRPHNYFDPEKGVYRLYPKMSGAVPLGAAVQSPDYSVASKMRTAAFDRGGDRNSVKVSPQDEAPIPVREHLTLAQDKLKLNYLFWSSNPRQCFENVKTLLAQPDLARDPVGGLDARLPAKAFLK